PDYRHPWRRCRTSQPRRSRPPRPGRCRPWMKGGLVFVCEIDGGKRRMSLPQSWTNRGPEALPGRFALDGLTAAQTLVDVMAARLSDADRPAAAARRRHAARPG